jgi:hypothetical protein
MKLISECSIIFIDGTFKSCPKNFKQIVNIIDHINNKNLTFPKVSVIIKTKYECSYFNLFELIKNNKDKPPTFHIDNLRANKITLNNKRIIRFVYSLQEEKYPLEKNFLYKIQDEFIYLDDNQLEENKY